MEQVFKDPYLDRVTICKISKEMLGKGANKKIKDCVLELFAEEVVDESDEEYFPTSDDDWESRGTKSVATVWLKVSEAEQLAIAILEVVAQAKLDQLAVMARNEHE